MEINWIKDSTETPSKMPNFGNFGTSPGGGGGDDIRFCSYFFTKYFLVFVFPICFHKKPNYLVRCLFAFRSGSGFFRLKR